MSPRVGFIGAGQMARALGRGFSDSGLVAAAITAYDPVAESLSEFARQIPSVVQAVSNAEVVAAAEIVILAVKPQNLDSVVATLSDADTGKALFVSILAGVPLSRLCMALKTEHVIRVMPNTPCLIGSGAAAFALGPGATQADSEIVKALLSSVGVAYQVDERQLDAVTGLSGSGPAYVYTMIEALSDGGVQMGLPRELSIALAAQTVAGAARMVLETGEHPAVLRDRVTSPGGTTIAGIAELERSGVRSALIQAVQSATRRSAELGAS